jgi:3-hydroxymyristoyl/3-hydroxydecanoyl-(acyl carrier protein) dehydratase
MESIDRLRLANGTYARPIIAIDQIIQSDEAKIIVRKTVTANEHFFIGHLPECPVFPGIFTLEIVLQAVRYFVSPRKYRLQNLKRVRYLAPVFPGDLIECTAFCNFKTNDSLLEVTAACRTEKGDVASFKLNLLEEE